MAFREKALHPTIGLYMGDTSLSYDDSGVVYTFDFGISFGLALALGGDKGGFVLHPTVRINRSFYTGQPGFGSGGGGAGEVVAAFQIKKFTVFARFGAEGHTLPTEGGWFGTDPEPSTDLKLGNGYIHLGFGYMPK